MKRPPAPFAGAKPCARAPAARARAVRPPAIARPPIVLGGVFVERALGDAGECRDLAHRHGGLLIELAHALGERGLVPAPRTARSPPPLAPPKRTLRLAKARAGRGLAGAGSLLANVRDKSRAPARAPKSGGSWGTDVNCGRCRKTSGGASRCQGFFPASGRFSRSDSCSIRTALRRPLPPAANSVICGKIVR